MLIKGVHIEVAYGTRGCSGMVDTCDYQSELIYWSNTAKYGIKERHEVNLRRVGGHARDNPWLPLVLLILFVMI